MKLKKKNFFIAVLVLLLVCFLSYFTVSKFALKSDSNKYEESTTKNEKNEEDNQVELEEEFKKEIEEETIKEEDLTINEEIINTKEEKKKEETKKETNKEEKKQIVDETKKEVEEPKKEELVVETPKENEEIITPKETEVVEEPKEEIKIEKISYSKNLIKMVVGETLELNPTITPSNATNKELIYSSSNPERVSVSEDGKITVLKANLNPTFIYIKSKENPDISTYIKIHTFDDVRIDSLKFQKSVETVDIATNGIIYRFKLNAPISAADFDKYTYCGLWMEYTSSNPDVARVQVSNVDNLLLNKPGTTIITARYRDGKTAQMELHVINSSGDQESTDDKLKYFYEGN